MRVFEVNTAETGNRKILLLLGDNGTNSVIVENTRGEFSYIGDPVEVDGIMRRYNAEGGKEILYSGNKARDVIIEGRKCHKNSGRPFGATSESFQKTAENFTAELYRTP